MKRTTSALVLVSLQLFLLVAGTLLVNSAKANPVAYAWLPNQPVTTPPTITILSPSQNQSYNSIDIWLNFTVRKPETWFSQTELSESYMPGTYMLVGRLVSYYYVLDGNESQRIFVVDKFRRVDSPEKPKETLTFSNNLTFTKGMHNITVVVECETSYVYEENRFSAAPKRMSIFGTSETVFFNVIEPISEDFRKTLVVVAASGTLLAAVSVSLLVCFKKRKGNLNSQKTPMSSSHTSFPNLAKRKIAEK